MSSLYRTLSLANNEVKYVRAVNKAQARSHVARKTIQVEVATPAQIMADVALHLDVQPVEAGAE